MQSAARVIVAAICWVLVAGLFVQVFLAGLGVFDSPEQFEVHRSFGFTLELLPLLIVVAGLVGRIGRRSLGLAALIFGLFLVQSILVGVRDDYPMVAALHPVNGFVILGLSMVLARRSLPLRLGTREEALGS